MKDEYIMGHNSKAEEVCHNKWRATIQINNKRIYLGLFNTFEEAAIAKKKANQSFKGKTNT